MSLPPDIASDEPTGAPSTPTPTPERAASDGSRSEDDAGSGEDSGSDDGSADAGRIVAAGESLPDGFLPPDEVLGRYVLLYRLGAGGMGVVYAAYDPKLDRKVALKLLRRPSADPSKRQRAQDRLIAEARALAQLNHPNVIAVHDVAAHGGRVVVAMEFVDGETLTARLAREPMHWKAVLEMMVRAGRGLAAAHDAGLVHRDFKPDNVMLGRDGRVHVMDFGLAQAFASEGVERSGPQRAGTPAYMAPEQYRGTALDGRSDQYSFCVTFFEALYGQRPFATEPSPDADPAERGEMRAPAHVKVPQWLRAALTRGLSIDPPARFPSMDALLAELHERPVSRARRRTLLGVAAASVAVGTGVSAIWPSSGDEPTLCPVPTQRLAGVWDPTLRAEIGARFSAADQPYAEASWAALSRELDTYAQSWLAMHQDACTATRVRHEQSGVMLDLRMECLGRRIDELGALTELLSDADAQLVRVGVAAASKLMPVSVCADAELLNATVPVPDDPQVRENIRELRASLAQIKVHEDAGRYPSGLALARVAVERARTLGYAPVLAEALYREARLAVASGALEDAEPLLREAIQTASTGHDDLTAAQAWTALVGVVGHGRAKDERAQEIAEAARAAVNRAGSPSEMEAELAMVVGASALQHGRLEEARDAFQQALEHQRIAVEPGHVSLARHYNNLAAVHLARQDARAAKRNLDQAIEIAERTHGPEHPSVAPMRANLAGILLEQGRTTDARAHLEEAERVWERSGVTHRSYLGQAQLMLSLASMIDGRHAEAEAQARQALENVQPRDGKPHPNVARALSLLGTALQEQGRDDEAFEVLTRAERIGHETLPGENDELAQILTDKGIVQLRMGRRDDALQSLEAALRIRETRPGFSTELPRLRFALARVVVETDLPRAIRLARTARAGYQALPREHPMRRVLNDLDAWIARHAPSRADG